MKHHRIDMRVQKEKWQKLGRVRLFQTDLQVAATCATFYPVRTQEHTLGIETTPLNQKWGTQTRMWRGKGGVQQLGVVRCRVARLCKVGCACRMVAALDRQQRTVAVDVGTLGNQGQEDKRTRGQEDKRTRGQEDKRIASEHGGSASSSAQRGVYYFTDGDSRANLADQHTSTPVH